MLTQGREAAEAGNWQEPSASGALGEDITAGTSHVVIGRFLGDRNIMRMALAEACVRHAVEPPPLR